MNIIILGPQGSGKGTQADILSDKMGLMHIESGKLLREKSATDPRIKEMVDNGVIVPDQEVIDLIEDYTVKSKTDYKNMIFDGYPRKVSQYELLKKWVASKGENIDKVIYLEISDESSIKRLSARRTCSSCGKVYNLITNPPKSEVCDSCGGELMQRDDDTSEVIKKRLENYHRDTEPILEYAQRDGILIRVEGERPINEIATEIISILQSS